MRHLFFILVLIAVFVTAPQAIAGDLISSRAVLEDRSGALTIADVAGRQTDFKPVGPTLSKGFTKSVYWLRFQVKPPARGKEVVLLIRQPFLNEIRLYEADAGSPQGWKSRVTGNFYPFSERERGRQTLGFVIIKKSSEATYYLRLKTATQVQMSVEALEPAEAERMDDRFDLMELFFVTSMLLLLLWALHSYLLDRLPVVGLFALHQAAYTLFGVAITGYLAPFLPIDHPDLVNLSTAIPYCAVSFTTLLFCRELFRPYQPPPLLMRGLILFLLLFPLQLVAMSQEAVERVLGRLITDEQFRCQAADMLETACYQEGYRISAAELRLLSSLEIQRIPELADRLDPGLCRVGGGAKQMK